MSTTALVTNVSPAVIGPTPLIDALMIEPAGEPTEGVTISIMERELKFPMLLRFSSDQMFQLVGRKHISNCDFNFS